MDPLYSQGVNTKRYRVPMEPLGTNPWILYFKSIQITAFPFSEILSVYVLLSSMTSSGKTWLMEGQKERL